MKRIKFQKMVLFAGAILLTLVLAGSISSIGGVSSSNNTLKLAAPEFLTAARAQTPDIIADRLDAEAGISAYYLSPDPINLTNAAAAFQVIETQTAEYIIGSVPVPGYEEHFDAHVYVNTNGWILAYYMRDEPVSKMIDIRNSSITNTNLNSVVAVVAGSAGVPFSSVTYYDFRYPNATHILLVFEDNTSGNDYSIILPSAYGYYERGFAIRDIGASSSPFFFNLDGVYLPSVYGGFPIKYGTISASQLLPDTEHVIVINDHGILIIVYREQ